MNHGVTSALWDHLFNTHATPGMIRVPQKHAMPWLTDPATGAVRPEHRADYELVVKRAHRAKGTTGAQPSAANAPIEAPVPGLSLSPNASMRSNLVRNSR